jgi:hypothetical protein
MINPRAYRLLRRSGSWALLLASALAAVWFVTEVHRTPPIQSLHYDSHVLELFRDGALVILLLIAAAVVSPQQPKQDSNEK